MEQETRTARDAGAPVKIGAEAVRAAAEVLRRYRAGKQNLDRRIIDNEQFWKLRHWEQMEKAGEGGNPEDVRPASGWLVNCILSKHADAMDCYPEPTVLPREPGDRQEAETLSRILPVLLKNDRFRRTYSKAWWDKLKSGCAVYGVFWDNEKLHGLGDVSIRSMDVLNLFWEPGVTDIQESEHFFCTELVPNNHLVRRWPELEGKLGRGGAQVSRYLFDDKVDTSEQSLVVDWYYHTEREGRQVLQYCKFVGENVLYATENDPEMAARGWYDHGKYPFVFDTLFPEEGTPCGYGYVDLCKSAQKQIDLMNQAILKNTLAAATPRFFIRADGAVNENEYADWTALYTTVNQANLVIRHVPAMGLKEKPRAFCLGNAHFIRAYCFFQIARIWGDAPLALTGYESTAGDLYLPRAPKAEIFARIESDLTEAERYVTDNSDKAVATPAAVQMLKADYALWMYRVAGGGSSYLAMAEKAIEALNLSASRLESDYAQVFSSANKLNKEVIFAVHQANGEAVNGPGYYLGWNSNYVEAAYQNNPVPITGGNQWWWYTDRYKALLTSVEGDTRTKLTYNRADYGTTIKSIEWTEKGVGQMISGARIFDSDFILYRYAEAFLMDAEIKYYRKDYGGALTALGEITKRAYGNAAYYTDQSDVAVKRAIVEESLKELVGEGRTWWTLIRLDAVWDYNKDVADKRESNANILLWPITQESIIKNSKLKQTEGWY